jgi:hypothetical protein
MQYIIYNILNSNTMFSIIFKYNSVEFLNKHSTSISSIRLFLENDYGTIIPQAFSKLVLPNILLT